MAIDARAVARAAIEQSLATQRELLEPDRLDEVVRAARMIGASLAAAGKLLLFGNGGSAGDASHIAAEFVGRFMAERRALAALSLCTDECAVTAIANDYGYERVFSRQIEALGAPADLAIAISTSGRSPNVLAGVRAARRIGMTTIGLTGGDGGELAAAVDLCLTAPGDVTARIQEGHILIAHVLCELVELELR